MRLVVQRVTKGEVHVDGTLVGAIAHGLVVLVGCGHDDTENDALWCAQRIAHLRIFHDENKKMNRSVQDINGSILAVPQFTLYGDCTHGRRPDFTAAAPPEKAAPLFERFCTALEDHNLSVAQGVFGAHMQVIIHNDGPVTCVIDRNEQCNTPKAGGR